MKASESNIKTEANSMNECHKSDVQLSEGQPLRWDEKDKRTEKRARKKECQEDRAESDWQKQGWERERVWEA